MKDPNAAKLEKHRVVYWLPCSATEHTDGAPLCPNPRTARLAVEAPPISVPDPDATPMQLEESEETRRPKHRALPANVSKEEFDSHQLTHLPFTIRPKINSNDFGCFWKKLADSNSNFVVANLICLQRFEFLVCSKFNHPQWSYMCMCCGLFAPTQFHVECCGFRDDS